MAKSLAILSGKGGSGKTTLALSLSQLMAFCKKKVLLIDCDMSTHGATYFFEEDLDKDKDKYANYSSLVINNCSTVQNGITNIFSKKTYASSPFDVILSIERLDDNKRLYDTVIYDEIIVKVFEKLDEKYDVILFDCQAGYCKITEQVLSLAEKSLIVLEPDLVSIQAVRTLYRQLGEIMDRKKTLQVFNKVVESERKIYADLPAHSTIFTNLKALSFNWLVRAAFSDSKIPDVNNDNLPFANEICELAISLFPKYEYDIQQYLLRIKDELRTLLLNQKMQIEAKIKKTKRPENYLLLVISSLLFIIPIFFRNKNYINDYTLLIFIITAIPIFLISVLSATLLKPDINKVKGNTDVSNEQNYDIDIEIKRITNELKVLKEKLGMEINENV